MGLVVVVLGLWGVDGAGCVQCACAQRERERERIQYLIEAAMNGVSTIVLRLLFIVKISGLSVRADALVFWMSLVKFLTKNYFNHPDVSALASRFH